MEEVKLIANAAFGLEAIVHRELRGLGFEEISIDDGRVRFKGTLEDVCRTNIWLRTAERVQIVVGEFWARDFDELFDQTKELPWERWLGVDAKFPVNARSVRSLVRSVPTIQKMVKRSIVERMRQVYSRHWFAETGPEYEIDVSILNDKALITLDTTGPGLHKRGYRPMVGDAPLRESLAAGMLLVSYWNKSRQLIDPFCGTGTIAIEAAMLGRNMAPGKNREFAAELWPQFPAAMWNEARKQARDVVGPPLEIPIIASDIDPRALKLARRNAENAGVGSDIIFQEKPFIEFHSEREFGCVVTNPPYGERLGTQEEVSQLHHEMGQILTMFETWSHYIITSAPRFEREFGRRADRRRKLFNGRIECTLYQYLGPRPPWEPAPYKTAESTPPTETAEPGEMQTDEARSEALAEQTEGNSWEGTNLPVWEPEALPDESETPVAQETEQLTEETSPLEEHERILPRPAEAESPVEGSEIERRMASRRPPE